MLWKIFGPKEDEGGREWIMLHNEELHKKCILSVIGSQVSEVMMDKTRNEYTVLGGNHLEGRLRKR
jgi:hypothetical protein